MRRRAEWPDVHTNIVRIDLLPVREHTLFSSRPKPKQLPGEANARGGTAANMVIIYTMRRRQRHVKQRKTCAVESVGPHVPQENLSGRFGLVWFGLVWFGLVWVGLVLVWFGLVWFGLVWFGLGWVGLGWVGLGWVGLGWVGLGWVG